MARVSWLNLAPRFVCLHQPSDGPILQCSVLNVAMSTSVSRSAMHAVTVDDVECIVIDKRMTRLVRGGWDEWRHAHLTHKQTPTVNVIVSATATTALVSLHHLTRHKPHALPNGWMQWTTQFTAGTSFTLDWPLTVCWHVATSLVTNEFVNTIAQ